MRKTGWQKTSYLSEGAGVPLVVPGVPPGVPPGVSPGVPPGVPPQSLSTWELTESIPSWTISKLIMFTVSDSQFTERDCS